MYYKSRNLKYEDFFRDYLNVMDNNEYGIILFFRRSKSNDHNGRSLDIDWNVNSWNLYNEQPLPPKSSKKSVKNHVVEKNVPQYSKYEFLKPRKNI